MRHWILLYGHWDVTIECQNIEHIIKIVNGELFTNSVNMVISCLLFVCMYFWLKLWCIEMVV